MNQAATQQEIDRHELEAAFDLVADDFSAVNEFIRDHLKSEVVLINQIADYIIHSGGKRLRPLLVLLAARACGYQGQQHIQLASVIEFIHTATLLHDDVVDESERRRGQPTAHAVWGNAASVLVGDFLYSRSFQMMVAADSMAVMAILSETTNTIAEGEVLQLLNLGDPEVTVERYMRVIENKTAKLFEAATRLGAVISSQAEPMESALACYGRQLGSAFQIADDVLDYAADSDDLGKNLCDDLAEGKPTLPLIIARERADTAERAMIDRAIRKPSPAAIEPIRQLVTRCGALAAANTKAGELAAEAAESLSCLPESDYRTALQNLARFSVARIS